MYLLSVHFPGEAAARLSVPVTRASDVLARIPDLLAEHPGCERVVVYFNGLRLFGVDRAGNRAP